MQNISRPWTSFQPPASVGGCYFREKNIMNIKKGSLYFIDDAFFNKINDPFLKKNYQTTKRPHYFAFQEPSSPLIWVVPCSSQIIKYQKILASKKAAGRPTDTIKIVKIQGREEVLLFQDMFPIHKKYINSQYIRDSHPVYISNPKIVSSLEKNAAKIIELLRREVKFTPSQPNAKKIEQIMLSEVAKINKEKTVTSTSNNMPQPVHIASNPYSASEIFQNAKQEAADWNRKINKQQTEEIGNVKKENCQTR